MKTFELGAGALLDRLEAGELTSRSIVEALLARRRDVEPRINAFVWEHDQALADADAADTARERGESLGPLHGLPITIKENVDIAGTDSTLGMESLRGVPAARDAVLVEQLRACGAIVLGKTNVPQLLLAQETENSLFGVTNNPWNLERVPGGSSGGEGAAIASGMSPLGIGTDIGGSIRIPAHFCGLVGFKPTLDRWSNRGSQGALKGQEVVRSQIGCLARSVDDVALLWKALDPREQSARDPLVAPLSAPAPDEIDLSGLRIGFFDDDPFLEPVQSLQRAVRRAREVLEERGATVVTHHPVASEDIIFTWLAAISADGGATIDDKLSGEPISPQLKPSRLLMRLPDLARRAATGLTSTLGEARVSRLLDCLGQKDVQTFWSLTQRRTDLRLQEFDRWRQAELDALICPPHVIPALGHRESGDFTLSVGSEFRWTLLNFPAGVVPVTRARPDEVGRYQHKSDRIERKVADIDRKSAGLPVGVQVVAKPYQEQVLIAVMQAIHEGVRDDDGFPTTPVGP
jgi:fatty acid amide hydrolase